MNARKKFKFRSGVYDVINSALCGGVRQINGYKVFISDNSHVGKNLTWSQAQAKAYRHRNLNWGGDVLILRRHGT